MAAVVSNITSSHDQVLMLEGDEDGLGRERVEWGEEEKLLLWQTGTMLRKGAPVQIPVTGTSFSTSFSIAGGNKITKIFVI